jgi:YD repeat-containing protein
MKFQLVVIIKSIFSKGESMNIGLNCSAHPVLRSFMLWGITLLLCSEVNLSQAASTLETVATTSGKYFTTNTQKLPDGTLLDQTIINGPSTPPPGFELQRQAVSLPVPNSAAGTNTLSVPAFNWVFGCSAVSGAMIASYYDRNGYPDMYTGPSNGGVMPMDNSSWPTWSDGVDTYPNCPVIASHNGVDGRATKGSIDDYWVQYGSTASDPYITGSWTQHTWSDAIGDYMKTSQSAYGNSDGSTTFWNYTSSATPLTCADMVSNGIDSTDGTYGRKLFYEARGYTVTDCYSQKTDNTIAGGFSFAQLKAEIDAGRPVMLNLAGHTVVAVGYDDSGNTVFIHDTWDYLTHSMTWGTSYSGMQLLSVSIVNLATTDLSVTTTNPADGATGVSPATSVSATFSYEMNPSTINTSTFTLDNWVTGTVSYDSGAITATFTPNAPLAYNTTYTATISTGVANSDGTNLAEPKTWSFTTGGPAILLNGDFELGDNGSWAESSSGGWELIVTNGAFPHGGSNYAWLGGYEGGTDVLYQDLTIPFSATSAVLRFWYRIATQDLTGIANDILTVSIIDPADNAVLQTLLTKSNVENTGGSYLQSAEYDLSDYRGYTIRLVFKVTTNSDGLNTNFFLDDVTLQAVDKSKLSASITGNGSVNSDPGGIHCTTGNSGFCSHLFNTGQTVALMPTAGSDSILNGWSGCTSLSGNNCMVSMPTDKTVTATFIVTPAVRIFGLGGYSSLQPAYNAAETGNTIQARAMELPDESLTMDLGKTVLIEGGYDASYSSNIGGYTTMTGVLTLGSGVLTVENLIIK